MPINYPTRPANQISQPKPSFTDDNQLEQEEDLVKQYNFERASVDMPQTSLAQHFKDKLRQTPAIPITFAATCGAFAMMTRHRKNRELLNYWARWRLVTQAACFASLFYAMYRDQMQKNAGTGGWLPYQWFTEDGKSSDELKKKYFEKH